MTQTMEEVAINDAPIGSIVWHCSDEDSGPDVGVSIKLGDTKMLWCGEITSKVYHESECESYGPEPGWWLILYDGDLTKVIARCFDHVAALDLLETLGWHIRAAQVDTHAERRDAKQARPARVGSAVAESDAPKASPDHPLLRGGE